MNSLSYSQKSFTDELNSALVDLLEVSKNFIYKHHKILAYF